MRPAISGWPQRGVGFLSDIAYLPIAPGASMSGMSGGTRQHQPPAGDGAGGDRGGRGEDNGRGRGGGRGGSGGSGGGGSGEDGGQRQAAIAAEFNRRRRRRRRTRQARGAGIGVAVATVAAVAAYSSGVWQGGQGTSSTKQLHGSPGPVATSTTKPAATRSAAAPVTSAISASTTTTTTTTVAAKASTTVAAEPSRPALREPLGGKTLVPGYRIVAFYGVPGAPALGVLGDASPSALWPRLAAQAAPYAASGIHVLPAYEVVAFAAQGSAGPAGDYSTRLSNRVISSYLSAVKAHHGLLILDIQPGRGSFLADAKTLAPFLAQPDVGLALDPQWKLTAGDAPDVPAGQVDANSLNAVSSWLSKLDSAHELPQKLLLVHQVLPNMIVDKAGVLGRSNLAIVFSMDGFGPPSAKATTYAQMAADHKFPLGYRLYYRQDTPLLDPAEVLALRPAPDVIEYE